MKIVEDRFGKYLAQEMARIRQVMHPIVIRLCE